MPRLRPTTHEPASSRSTRSISDGRAGLARRTFLGLGAVASVAAIARRARSADDPDRALLEALRRGLGELEDLGTRHGAKLSASVLDVASGRELGAIQPRVALNPASNQKILTAIAALSELGPSHRFTTLLAGHVTSGALDALVLRGDGDPELTAADLGRLIDDLVDRGVSRVNGDVLVDQSAFDAAWDPPGYAQRPNEWAAYRAPVSAIAIGRNAVILHVLPGIEGQPARVWFEPRGLVTIQGSVASGKRGSAQNVRLTVKPNGDRLDALVGGSAPAGSGPLTFSRRIAAPELAPGHVLVAELGRRALPVTGAVRAGGAGVGPELASLKSRPLAQLLPALGKHSDNFTAEMLLKAVGRAKSGKPGSSAAGAQAIEALLTREGAFDPGTRVGNGSGLYDANRVSAFALARALASAHVDPRVGPELLASLAIGGVDGTLSNRFKSLAARRSVRAKTGTLADVAALSGYVLRPAPRAPLAFALLVNGVAGKLDLARRRMDALIEALANA